MPIVTSYRITGVAPFLRKLEGLEGPALKRRTAQSLGRSARKVLAPAIAAHTPFHYGGHRGRYPTKGLLGRRSSITARNVRTRPGEMVAISIKPRVWFEHMVVRGTKPHLIAASGVFGAASASQVRSQNRGTGAPVLFFNGIFATQVQHPGARPNDYIHAAAQGKESAILDQLARDLLKEAA